MAIDFPSTPTAGQEFGGYYWDDTKEVWRSQSTNRGSVITSATTPTGATAGDMWFNTVDGTMFVYYDDGITEQWVEVQANVDNYKTPSQNYIINSEFDIWQRGTAFSSVASGTYTADRWVTTVGSQTVSRNTDAPTGLSFSLRVQRSAATSSGIATRIEAADAGNLVGKTVTISYWARTPQTSQTIRAVLSYPTTTADVFSSITAYQTLTATPTSLWARYSFTFAVTADFARGLQLTIGSNSSGDATHDLYIAGVQLEEGTIATPFRRNQPNIQAELAACQRYYQVWNQGVVCFGTAYATTGARINLTLQQQMRVSPTSFGFSSLSDLGVELPGVAFGGSITAIDNFNPTRNTALWNVTFGSNANFGNNKAISFNVSAANGFFWVSAEL